MCWAVLPGSIFFLSSASISFQGKPEPNEDNCSKINAFRPSLGRVFPSRVVKGGAGDRGQKANS
jgi:hypothetical protein